MEKQIRIGQKIKQVITHRRMRVISVEEAHRIIRRRRRVQSQEVEQAIQGEISIGGGKSYSGDLEEY